MAKCISCGEESTHYEVIGRAKVIIHKDCIKTREPYEQLVKVQFPETTEHQEVIFEEPRQKEVN